jgi:S-layer protein
VDDSAILHLYADKATTVNATEGNADGTLTLTLDNRTDQLATLDASTLEGGLVNNATVADLVVKGGLGADELTAAADDVTLYGNDGDDTLIVESGLRVDLYGGEGADTFAIHSGASTSLDAYTVINGVDSGDVIAMTGADAFSSTEIALSVGADESLLNYANQAVATVDEGGMGWFERGGNTYIVQDVTSSTGEDMIIMITGVVDLSTASFNATGGTLEMA